MTISTTEGNPAETVREIMENIGDVKPVHHGASDIAFGVADTEAPILVSVPSGREIVDLSTFYDPRRQAPRRMNGTMSAVTLQSLIDWTNRFKTPDSVLFLDRTGEPSITSIANYHALDKPDFCDHRSRYAFPLSDEWLKWTGDSGNPMDVAEFGEFLENNAKDLLNPTAAMMGVGEPTAHWETRAIEVATLLGGRFGDQAQMLALGRDFRINVESKAIVKFDKNSGQSNIAFSQEHGSADGTPLRLPSLFVIKISVFTGGPVYPLLVRFLYRARGGVKLFYELYDPATALNDAIDEAAKTATEATGLAMFEGVPEPIQRA